MAVLPTASISTRTFIIGAIAAAATLELLWGAWVLWGPKRGNPVQVNPATVTFALSPESGNSLVGQPFEVALMIHTNGRSVSAVDMLLEYDPRMLRAEPRGGTTSAVFATASALFDAYPNNQLDRAAGRISLSAIRSVGTSFNGSGIVGKVRFVPLTKGKAGVHFTYTPEGTTDSNAADVQSGKDVLGQVVGGVYEIQ